MKYTGLMGYAMKVFQLPVSWGKTNRQCKCLSFCIIQTPSKRDLQSRIFVKNMQLTIYGFVISSVYYMIVYSIIMKVLLLLFICKFLSRWNAWVRYSDFQHAKSLPMSVTVIVSLVIMIHLTDKFVCNVRIFKNFFLFFFTFLYDLFSAFQHYYLCAQSVITRVSQLIVSVWTEAVQLKLRFERPDIQA